MAADVRDTETETSVLKDEVRESDDFESSCVSDTDTMITLNSEISSIPENDREGAPSHAIVHRQMKDAILSQRFAVQKLVQINVSA